MKKYSLLRAVALGIATLMTAASLFSCTPSDDGDTGKGPKKPDLDKVSLEHVYKVNYLDAEIDRNSWIQSAISVGEDTFLIGSYYKETFVPFENVDETAEGEVTNDGGAVTLPAGALAKTAENAVVDIIETDIAIDSDGDGIADDDVAEDVPVDETQGTWEYENGIRLLKISPDGKVEKVRDFVNTYETDEAAKRSTFINYNTLVPTEGGKVWALINDGFDDWSDEQNYQYESNNRLVLYTPDWQEEVSVNVQEALKPTLDEENKNRNIYIDRFFLTPGGDIIVYGNNLIAVLDGTGKLLHHGRLDENMWINSFVQLRNGDVVGMSYAYDNTTMRDERKIVRINPETAGIDVIGDMPFANAYNIFPAGEDNKVLVNNQSSLFVYDLVTGELTEEINWLNSDLNGNRVSVLSGLADGSVLISESSRNYDSMKLARLTEVGDKVEKYVVNFASVYLDDNMTEAIISFNKQNEEYRIVYNDYSVYNTEDDYEAGIKQLNNDIIAGKIPDLMSLDGLDFDVYASKGLLYDINLLMNKDESFNRADYLENILEATTVGGKLYSIIPNFTIQTLVGKKSIVGDRMSWTMEDLKKVMAEYPDAVVFGTLTKQDVLNNFTRLSLDKYIDTENGSCSFDSPEFVSVLELINSFPEEIDWDKYYENMTEEDYMLEELQYLENRTLLSYVYISRFNYPYQARMFGEEVSYVGFPVPEGIGSAISPSTELAISAKTKGMDIAWAFVKYLLSEEYQKDTNYTFSINRKVTEDMAKKALEEADKRRQQLAEREEAMGGVIGGSDIAVDMEYAGNGVMVSATPAVAEGTDQSTQDKLNNLYKERLLTKEDADALMALITSVNSVARSNPEVEKIITEESAAYFSGQKTAQEVAKTIQSKVFLYVSEGF